MSPDASLWKDSAARFYRDRARKTQVKHIDFTAWKITLPPEVAKGGATSDQAEVIAFTQHPDPLPPRPEIGSALMGRRGGFATAATRAALAAGLGLVIQCGPTSPSGSVTGNWRFSLKTRGYEMSLTQTGNSISGVACVYSLDFLSQPPREVPVTGEYPAVRFTDPMIPNCTYDATFEKDRDQIAGDCGDRSLVRFDRGGSGRCERPIR